MRKKQGGAKTGKLLKFPLRGNIRKEKMAMMWLKKRNSLLSSLVSVFFIMLLLNIYVSREKTPERNIAFSEDERKQWEKKIATKLSSTGNGDRTVASLGKTPELFDKLVYEALKGNYSVLTKEGKVYRLDSFSTPLQIGDLDQFVEKYRSLWPHEFTSIQGFGSTQLDASQRVYSLYKGDVAVAQMLFTFNDKKQLLKLEVQEISK